MAPKKKGATAGGKKASAKNSGGRKSSGEEPIHLDPPLEEETARWPPRAT